MGRPNDIDLFAAYHLGLGPDRTYRFRNLAECARLWQTDPATLQRWLGAARIDADTVKSVSFNLTRWHVEAQFVTAADAPALVGEAWRGDQEALRGGRGGFHHDVDYDDIWGDGGGPEREKP